jgi:hypothetical protein
MQTWHKALLAGAAAIAIGCCGATGSAMAQSTDTHVMTVRLPDGGVAQISYTGNVAPRISFSEAPAPIDVFASPAPAMFGPNSPFAALERISAEMDRQAAAMFQQAESLAAAARSGQLTEAAMQSLPPGGASASYSSISTMSGNGSSSSFCTQSIEITSPGNGAPPRVVSHSSGNCAPMGGSSGSVNQPTMMPQPFGEPGPVWTSAPAQTQTPYPNPAPPDMLWTSAHGARPYAGLVEEIPPAQQR